MDLPLHILIGSIFGLIILSAFFSGSETSLTSASKPRMHNLARTGKKNAKIFEELFKNKELLIVDSIIKLKLDWNLIYN